jgi:hypothetical protein
MVTEVPTVPEVGEMLFILGVTVKVMPLLGTPLTVTRTGPVVAPAETGATMLAELHEAGVLATPLNVNVLVS